MAVATSAPLWPFRKCHGSNNTATMNQFIDLYLRPFYCQDQCRQCLPRLKGFASRCATDTRPAFEDKKVITSHVIQGFAERSSVLCATPSHRFWTYIPPSPSLDCKSSTVRETSRPTFHATENARPPFSRVTDIGIESSSLSTVSIEGSFPDVSICLVTRRNIV